MINFNTNLNSYQVILPLSTEVLIPKDDSVRIVRAVLEQLDFSAEAKEYAKRKRKVPFCIMLRVVVYGFMRNFRSVRELERACRENINFIWLLEGYLAPDHNTIARFIAAVDMNAVLVKVNKLLIQMKEIRFENAFIDGTKIEANAGRYSFVWKGAVEKNRAKLLLKTEAFLAEIHDRYGIEFLDAGGVVNYLEYLDIRHNYGKGKRKSQEQRDLETAKELHEKLLNYDFRLETIGQQRRSMSKTDPDATFMRLKDDHMKNGQLKPAYNVQLCIESEYITSLYVSADRNDEQTLKPFLDKIETEYGCRHKNVTLDSGYESEENYAYLEENKQMGFIKPQNYEQAKTTKYKAQIGRKENMLYNPLLDQYTCQNGKLLCPIGNTTRKSKNGYEQKVTVYECSDCSDCEKRQLCTKAQDGKNKQVSCSRLFESYRSKSLARITSAFGTQLRLNRSIQSEGAFGIIKQDYRFRRFNRKGHQSIIRELSLICIAFNLNKLHNNILNNRLNFTLHELST